MSIKNNDLILIMKNITNVINENKEYLTELDSKIGDADHGINLSKGFNASMEKLNALTSEASPETILKTVAMTLISTVGGASGPLYGTFFLKASGTVKGKDELDINDLFEILNVGIEGVKLRGKSDIGEKTMLDSLIPAKNMLKSSIDREDTYEVSLRKLVESAREGMENTKNIIATKGRASYLGERSLGHIDPGATSSYLILKSLKDTILKN